MRRIEFGRGREEASCGVRGELLNRWSQVRILSPAPPILNMSGPPKLVQTLVAGVSTPRVRTDWSREFVTLTESGPNLGPTKESWRPGGSAASIGTTLG